jgi:hypothetical protein
MPKARKAAKAKKTDKKRDARYEAFRADWERAMPRRLYRERGRGKPGDMDYRPPVIGRPRPHKTKAADFLDELLWLAAFVGDDCFSSAYVAAQASGAIKNGKWAKDFRPRPPPGLILDPFYGCLPDVARLIYSGSSQRAAIAWAVARFDLPGATFEAAVARMRTTFKAANKAGLFPAGVRIVRIWRSPEIK